jgi:drug/metabolite transporter (DMT)-like permease
MDADPAARIIKGVTRSAWRPIGLVLISAALFGASFPASKTVLSRIPPLELAGFFYLFSGAGTALLRLLLRSSGPDTRFRRGDERWLVGSVFVGGVAGPILLMFGLERTPAHIGSLLAGSETLFTVILAVAFFGDVLLKRELAGAALILAGSAMVALAGSESGGSLRWQGPLLLLGAGLAWGLDNNFTARLSGRDPLLIAVIKGFGAGTINLGLACASGSLVLFDAKTLGVTAFVGVFCYGVAFALFVVALRHLGASRTSAIYGTGPAFGVLFSWLALGEIPRWMAIAGGCLMLISVPLFVRKEGETAYLSTGPEKPGPPAAT